MVFTILLAAPRGFCAGVSRAIDIVELALERFGPPIYVRHAIVHNDHVVEGLEKKGVVFIEDLTEIPSGSYVIFSAHGSSPSLRQEALELGLKPIDAVCPLVTKVHVEARRFLRQGKTVIYVGHKGHQEATGVTAHGPMHLVETVADVKKLPLEDKDIAVLTQTTLSVDDTASVIDAIKRRFPSAHFPGKEDICYATTNRQAAVKEMARRADLVLVVGSSTSSNSVRLVETAQAAGTSAHLINDKDAIKEEWLKGVKTLGLTSGASGPESLVQDVINFYMEKNKGLVVETVKVAEEDVEFVMPQELAS